MLFKGKMRGSLNIFDLLWILNFIWIIFTWTFNDYPHKGILILRCFSTQIAYMMTYWIARKSTFNYLKGIIETSYIPLTITCVIGIYCFFFPPTWYQAITDRYIASKDIYMTETLIAELSRLRSIFDSPYTLSYFISMTLIYEWFCMIKKERQFTTKYMIFIGLLISTMILAMMRAPIVCSLLSFILAIFYGLRYKKSSSTTRKMIIALSIGLIGVFVVVKSLDDSFTKHIFSKYNSVTNEGGNFLMERLFLMNVEMTLEGDGTGRHAIYADKYPPNYSLRDGEYMKIIAEQGYIGFTIIILLFSLGLIKSFFNLKNLSFEFCLICMLFITMIGANPLSTADKYPIIFWLALGRISTYKNSIYGINNYCNLQCSQHFKNGIK